MEIRIPFKQEFSCDPSLTFLYY